MVLARWSHFCISLTYLLNRRGWQKCLEDHCAELKGHRLVWRKDADPYRMKLVRSARSTSESLIYGKNPVFRTNGLQG